MPGKDQKNAYGWTRRVIDPLIPAMEAERPLIDVHVDLPGIESGTKRLIQRCEGIEITHRRFDLPQLGFEQIILIIDQLKDG
jgi:hypothetical protein